MVEAARRWRCTAVHVDHRAGRILAAQQGRLEPWIIHEVDRTWSIRALVVGLATIASAAVTLISFSSGGSSPQVTTWPGS
ncbi:hypothetical protein ACGFIG_29380 [Micromonospora sp. NPDC049048]|uniref:hypothetical protein n=1 Tax=Micromonospora sp. NPDC049048 TaxID=3364263 RepID=UPI00371AE4E4